jgi:hypothetical protein
MAKVFKHDQLHYNVDIFYDCYKYCVNGDTLQKPEKYPYWTHNCSEVAYKKLTKLSDYTNSNKIFSRLSSICNTSCTMVVDADQGQGK